jgi:hypothetical protein
MEIFLASYPGNKGTMTSDERGNGLQVLDLEVLLRFVGLGVAWGKDAKWSPARGQAAYQFRDDWPATLSDLAHAVRSWRRRLSLMAYPGMSRLVDAALRP